MIITKCDKCGAYVHKADRCFNCGSSACFTEIDLKLKIHENVRDEYKNLRNLVTNGRFDEALSSSKFILEWMPNSSEVFWLRLLAKNSCNSDDALIRKGVSCEESAEYHNALMFANEIQKKVYLCVASKISAVKKVLTQYIVEHEYLEKSNTVIAQIQTEYPTKIDLHKKNLFKLWDELRCVEAQMMAIEKDCLLLVKEHKETLNRASSEAASIKATAYKLEQCTAEQLHKYQTQFGELLYQSEQAKAAIDSMRKQHPWIGAYNNFVSKRDNIVSQINNEIKSLRNYESRVKSTVSEIERIETRHASALASVDRCNFYEIRSLLGEEKFMSAYIEAGLR